MAIALENGGGGTILARICPCNRAIISAVVLGFFGLKGGGVGITVLILAPGTWYGASTFDSDSTAGAGIPIAFVNGGGGIILDRI